MMQPDHELHGYEGITAEEVWFMMTGENPTPEQTALLDDLLTERYRQDFDRDPPVKYIIPDAPRLPVDED
jgi:hypothetical protein